MSTNTANDLVYPDFEEFLSDLSECYLNEENFILNSKYMNGIIIVSLNIRSLSANHNELKIFIDKLGNKRPHIIGLQETFRIDKKSEHLLKIPNYNLHYCSRNRFKGGGVCFYIREDITTNVLFNLSFMHEGLFEAIAIDITLKNETIRLGNFYRSEKIVSNKKRNEKFNDFCEIFDTWISKFSDTDYKCILLSDTNLNHLNKTCTRYQRFIEIMFCSGFIPIFKLPTRFNPKGNHTLIDNIYVNHLDVQYAQQCTDSFSDHNILSISVTTKTDKNNSVPEKETKIRSLSLKNIFKFKKIL